MLLLDVNKLFIYDIFSICLLLDLWRWFIEGISLVICIILGELLWRIDEGGSSVEFVVNEFDEGDVEIEECGHDSVIDVDWERGRVFKWCYG